MQDLQSELNKRISAFAADIAALVREAALEAAKDAFKGHGSTATKARNSKPSRSRGGRRSPDELETIAAKLEGYIKANPGQRIEQIGKGLGLPTKELTRPVTKLLASKAIKKTGDRRATKYYPGGGGGGGAKRKRAKA